MKNELMIDSYEDNDRRSMNGSPTNQLIKKLRRASASGSIVEILSVSSTGVSIREEHQQVQSADGANFGHNSIKVKD